MNWLRDHMREQLAKAPSAEPVQNVVHFPAEPAQVRREPASALGLVSQAADVIRGIQERAAESEARAKALAECALEKLEMAEARINDAEAARGQAEEAVALLRRVRPSIVVRPEALGALRGFARTDALNSEPNAASF